MLLELWAASLLPHAASPPFRNAQDLYSTIDSTTLGAVKWQSFEMQFPQNLRPVEDIPSWMTTPYDVWFRDVRDIARNILSSPDYVSCIDYGPRRAYDMAGDRELRNLMDADWAWGQAVQRAHNLLTVCESQDIIATYPGAHGAAFVPIILGSDKTTVSIATGQNEYYPLYISVGNLHNTARRAHGGGVVLAAFLAIPKSRKKHTNDANFRKFRRQLFHSSLSRILRSLKEYMTTPDVVLCGDGRYRKVIYGLGPYIADYPEQALLACVVQGWCPICTADKANLDGDLRGLRSQSHTEVVVEEFELGELWESYGLIGDIIPFTNDFPRADIHELIAPDILHQLIKGTFKDHLVTWVELLLVAQHGKQGAAAILTDIDRRIAVVPPFSGLRRFHEGRGFKQWTGDDSKALMKVYLPAISGHLPTEAVQAICAFLEFCYLVRRESHGPSTLTHMNEALRRFHRHREAFRRPGVRPDGFSLPRQHSCNHYEDRIWAFGSPNGLCTSITESKHIAAVKEPWRRSNRFEALGQMLLTNQRLDKLAASRTDFQARGLLEGSCLNASEKSTETGYPRDAAALGPHVGVNELPDLIRIFLFHQLNPRSSEPTDAALALDRCPPLGDQPIAVFHSAQAEFHAAGDPTIANDTRRELIRCTPCWRDTAPRFDCIFVNRNSQLPGLLGMDIARVKLFFSFRYRRKLYPCALIHWYARMGSAPDVETGMWIVRPRYLRGGDPVLSVIHLDTIFRAAHLIGVSDKRTIQDDESEYTSLDRFDRFYVNKYIDHHAFEVLHT
ncbi:hypothetical protein OH77DRAFT_1562722 [Trametes cingulata]|nr:hypothetical protein OH77DRAFT_1562722 [Trametes cingulata]